MLSSCSLNSCSSINLVSGILFDLLITENSTVTFGEFLNTNWAIKSL